MNKTVDPQEPLFTEKQGQYLAYIYYYNKINGLPPAHTDLQKYFNVTPPSVNQMISTLEKKGLIQKIPKAPRSLKVLLPVEKLPALK
jgi:Mn-dependent DtxR family transcriptional regulator